MLKRFLIKHKFDLLAICLLSFTAPFFFFKLGQSSLVSWDEAWYAEIARNILKTGDFLNLSWNGKSYFDHPPFGFWLMAISMKIFGTSEFWIRFPSAVVGLLGIYATYFLGKELFNRVVGFSSALALASSFWFIYRARSGNLDVFLTVLFITTFLFAFHAVKEKKFLIPFAVSASFLFLTKTLIPLTIIPSLLLIFWRTKHQLKVFIAPIVIFFVTTGIWFATQVNNQPNFWSRYLYIGMPGVKAETSYLANLQLSKEYLHNGIGKWFWPGVAATFGSLFLFQKRFYILSLFIGVFYIPFIFSAKGHIWHLIPLHPFITIITFGFIFVILEKIIKQKKLINLVLVGVALYTSLLQIRQLWYQFIDIPAYVSDEAILSTKAGNFKEDFFIDGDFGPAAAFYSGKNVVQIWQPNLQDFFKDKKSYVLITSQWRLDQANTSQPQYRIIAKDRDKVLIVKQ